MTSPPPSYAGVRALVLGGSGFVGRWVARALADAGAELTVAARDPEAARVTLSEIGVGATVVRGALVDEASVRALLDDVAPDIVFNLVGYGVDRRERDEAEMARVNRDLVGWIADSMAARPRRAGWSGLALVHTGSALEYGANGGDLDEGGACRPTESYGRSKLAGTELVSQLAARTGLRAVTARLFTVYGPGEHEGRLLPSLVRAADTGGEAALSSGEQRRDFTFVGDVAEGLLRLGRSSATPGLVVNVATGRIRSVREFVEEAAPVLGLRAAQLRFGASAPRPEEMRHERVAVDRLRGVTGWVPATSVADGVRRTLEQPSTRTGSSERATSATSEDPAARPSTTSTGSRRDDGSPVPRWPEQSTVRSVRMVEFEPEAAGRSEPELSLVMPCYNEEENIGYTIPKLLQAFERAGVRVELVAVDNGSRDRTGELIAELARTHPEIVPVTVPKNEGYGHGLLTGMARARARWIETVAADGQVDPEDVLRLYEAVSTTHRPVIGKVRRRFRMDGPIRKVISVGYNLFVHLLWPGLGSWDVNGQPRILSRDVMNAMQLQSKNWFLDPEMLIKAHYMGVRIFEVNVFARMRGNGLSHVRAMTVWEFFTFLLRYRFSNELQAWRRASPSPAALRTATVTGARGTE